MQVGWINESICHRANNYRTAGRDSRSEPPRLCARVVVAESVRTRWGVVQLASATAASDSSTVLSRTVAAIREAVERAEPTKDHDDAGVAGKGVRRNKGKAHAVDPD